MFPLFTASGCGTLLSKTRNICLDGFEHLFFSVLQVFSKLNNPDAGLGVQLLGIETETDTQQT